MSFDTPVPSYSASDPHATFLNSSCLDFLLIELVPLAQRLANELSVHGGGSKDSWGRGGSGGGGGSGGSVGHSGEELDEEEEREAVFYRLEMLGYRVGQGLAERFSRDRARMVETLDVIKFCCKDLWTIAFRKQIDNLKTNHRGVYVLTDNTFRPFARMSTEAGGAAVIRAQPFLWFPCGVIRGALAAMGVNASVQAESTELPTAIFKIETVNKGL